MTREFLNLPHFLIFVQSIANILISRRNLLREYFSLGITIEGMVDSLPVLISDFTPNLDKLPLFFMRLGPQVSSLSPPSCRGWTLSQPQGQLEQ